MNIHKTRVFLFGNDQTELNLEDLFVPICHEVERGYVQNSEMGSMEI